MSQTHDGLNWSKTAFDSYQMDKVCLDLSKNKNISLQEIVERFVDGLLIITDKQELVYLNERARRIFRKLNPNRHHVNEIPSEIWHLSQFILESYRRFPHQNWMMESQVFTQNSVAIRVRVQYIQRELCASSYLIVTVEDLYKPVEKIALAEAEKYGLTPREKEVWMLQKENYTYKQIASELYITPNTVKKHMKSIYCKRKAYLGIE